MYFKIKLFLIIIFFTFNFAIFADKKGNFKKISPALSNVSCKSNQSMICLTYKYIKYHYPKSKELNWFENTSAKSYFEYKVIFENYGDTVTLIISIKSSSNGLEWYYQEDSIHHSDQLTTITSSDLKEKVKNYLNINYGKDVKPDKIEKVVIRTSLQNQRHPKGFYKPSTKTSYNIYIKNKVINFKEVSESKKI